MGRKNTGRKQMSKMSELPEMGTPKSQDGDVNKDSDVVKTQKTITDEEYIDILAVHNDNSEQKRRGFKNKRKCDHNEGISPEGKRVSNALSDDGFNITDDGFNIIDASEQDSISARTRSRVKSVASEHSQVDSQLDLDKDNVGRIACENTEPEKDIRDVKAAKSDRKDRGVFARIKDKASQVFGGSPPKQCNSENQDKEADVVIEVNNEEGKEKLSVRCINSPGSVNEFTLLGSVQDNKYRLVQESPGERDYILQQEKCNVEDTVQHNVDGKDSEEEKEVFEVDEDDDEKDDEFNELLETHEDDGSLAAMMRKIMQQEHKKFEQTISKFEKKITKKMNEESTKTYKSFASLLNEKYSAMEKAVEEKVEKKMIERYDGRIKQYENKIEKLETELKQKVTVKPSHDDISRVRDEIWDSLKKSDSFAAGVDNIVKQRIDKKVQSGEIGVNAGVMRELKDEMITMRRKMKNMQSEINILNPDIFEQEHLCVICTGVPYQEGEDPKKTAMSILTDLRDLLDEEDEKFECGSLWVLGAKRIGDPNARFPLLKIALGSQAQKVAVLKAKRYLANSAVNNRVRVRTSKNNTTRAMEDNFRLMKELIPELNDYTVAGNSRLVERGNQQNGRAVRRGNAGSRPHGRGRSGRGGRGTGGRNLRDNRTRGGYDDRDNHDMSPGSRRYDENFPEMQNRIE